jgi:hypothetical protein
MSPVRRSLAGLLFGLASIAASLAVSSFWLQYTAFSPGHTRGAVAAVLEDKDIKNEVAKLIADATAAQFPEIPPVQLQQNIVDNLNKGAGAKLLADTVSEAHARLIGERKEPVQITPQELVEIVRDERAFVVPAFTLPVPEVGPLSVMRQVLKWLVPIAGGIAVLLIVLGFAAHPEKPELMHSLAFLLFGIALLLIIIGYVIPAFVVPLFTDNVWVGALPRLANDSLPMLLVLALLLCGGGLACLIGATASKRRDRWSQPIRRTSYREERRWS